MLDGVVNQVSTDAHDRPESGNPVGKLMQDAAYRALINLGNGRLESPGRKLRLVPGTLVNSEIHLSTRSVLEYLLSPVQKVAHEAGRER
jgi:HlyD family secretion protein